MPRVEVEDLVKTYRVAERRPGMLGALLGVIHRRHRVVRALDGVSFAVEPGELVGYIGPNGAGKSTTVKLLSGILVPDSGRCVVGGLVPWRRRIAHVGRIGVVFGQRTQLWWDLPVVESFELLGAIYRVPGDHYRAQLKRLTDLLDLGPLLHTPVRQLSLGQRMRCDLAAALLHSPELLFLDEPTIGLDAVSKLLVRDFVKEINRERGLTVVLTTHDMNDVEALCSRVLVVHKGRIFCDGSLEDLRARIQDERVLIVDLENEADRLEIEGVEVQQSEEGGHRVRLSFDPRKIAPAELIARVTAAAPVRDLFLESTPIEHVVARLYLSEEMR